MKKLTQKQRVLSDLQANEGKWIPTWTWIDQRPRILRAGDCVFRLRQEGYDIETKQEKGDYYYRLKTPSEATEAPSRGF